MNARRRKLPGVGILFAPPQAVDHPLKIVQFRAWRLKGTSAYGEGGPALAAEIVSGRYITGTNEHRSPGFYLAARDRDRSRDAVGLSGKPQFRTRAQRH
jgi:hypothetical protein